MFNTGLPRLVKSGEKAIIWGWEKLTGKSLRSQEVSFSGCHSIPGIWNRCQKRFVVDWYWFYKSGKKHHILKTLSGGKWKTHNLQEKNERNVKVWKPFSGQWNVAIMQWFIVWNNLLWVIIKCWIQRACVKLHPLLGSQIACIVGTKKRREGGKIAPLKRDSFSPQSPLLCLAFWGLSQARSQGVV